ncbi:universal stress protein PHOS32-like isoform X2 [Tripterygium wilfordii]|uniref:universal stress protein PHOS32-like isoform X2 n=1 Tax=Tripterygium wilfordii TaxID=458696 RepID=UPI0018F857B6|nr:universal stress protein PHOS32-like isoform X2 [Tripterygium wilfordii]
MKARSRTAPTQPRTKMGRAGTRLPNFCLNRIRPHVRVRSPPIQSKHNVKATETDQKTEDSVCTTGDDKKSGSVTGRKIMIVVDSSLEAKGALQWALSHTIQSQDTLVLLHVTNPATKQGEVSNKGRTPRAYELVYSLKKTCQIKRPEVQIEVAVLEGKDKGAMIVEEARKQGVALLVLGQKKRSMTWRLIMMWAGNRVTGGVVEYCIQNAACMAIAVRRKSKKLGGYLITTKRHKDFWLLA